ncbi:MAG TPA: hypothetical protein VKO61_00695 [Candidatus Paceibacterota bacterium]|nr:hypothetical protein [Candidatus Paceibacterota bacterium]
MNNNFLKRTFKIFEKLSSKPKLGGLQITDSSLRYLILEGNNKADTFSVKLPPGVVLGGKVQDEEKFVYYLNQLHGLISPNNPNERLKTIVCLPSAITYTQNYNIPNVGDQRMKEAAELNLEMISPIPTENAYMSWQLINETEDKYELLGAFADKAVVDKFRDLLVQSNFMPMIFEFPSLALSWTINNSVGPRKESFLVLNVSGDGIDLFLLRSGSIYFDYYKSWKSIQGNNKKISRELFDKVLVEEVRKVVNFTSSRFNENLKYVFVVAPGLSGEVKKVLEGNFGVQAAPLQTTVKPLSPAWYPVLGSALRGRWDRSKDRYINLGVYRVEDMFFKEQMFSFISLWRNLLIGIISTFLILMSGSLFLLKTQPETLENRLKMFNLDFEQTDEARLRASVKEFNDLVEAVEGVKESEVSVMRVLDEIEEISSKYEVNMGSVSIASDERTIKMSGNVPSYEKVIDFKNALIDSSRFENVKMPFSNILTSEGNFVDFNVTFSYIPGIGND